MLRLNAVGIALLLTATPFAVQADELRQLTKNPFLQPDILSYRPPVQPIQADSIEVQEVWEPPAFELKAVIISQSEPMVLIDDSFLRIGEEYEDMRLISITEGTAIFRYKRKNYTYTLQDEPIGTR